MKLKRILKHAGLFGILFGSDIFIGFFGHYHGSDTENIIEYISTLSVESLIPVIFIAMIVVIYVEFVYGRR
jgi:hypothetical protein